MDKKTKPKGETQKNAEEILEKDEDVLVNDQIKHSYYYDDACGYEIYVEDDEENKDDDE